MIVPPALHLFIAGIFVVVSTGNALRLKIRPSTRQHVAFRLDAVGLEWLDKLSGVSFKKVALDDINGVRGVVAMEDIQDTDTIVSVPEDQVFETANNRPPTPFKDFVSQSLWESSKWDQRIGYKLLWENDVLGKDSQKFSWLQQLPSSYSTTYYWSTEELSQLQYNSLVDKVKTQRNEWKALFELWQKECQFLMLPQKATTWGTKVADIDLVRFVWALETVNSRAFSGAYEGSSAAERRAILLLTGALTLGWPLLGFGSPEQAIQGAVAVGLSIFLKDYFFSKNSSLKRYVMCPLIDMFNHKASCTSDASFNYFSGKFELRTQACKKGEQVFISYGKQSNDRLLQFYGFVEPDNMNDSYDFGESVLELVLKFSDKISQVVSIPSCPSPEIRLTSIANSLASTMMQDQRQGAAAKLGAAASTSTTRYFRPPQPATTLSSSSILAYFDDVTVRSCRALLCSPEEWQSVNPANGLQAVAAPLSYETESMIESLLRELCRCELYSKPTTLDQDIQSLTGNTKGFKKDNNADSTELIQDSFNRNQLATLFRIEKKKLLSEAIKK